MSHIRVKSTKTEFDNILNFVDRAPGLKAQIHESGTIAITQEIDHKIFRFSFYDLQEVLQRQDSEGQSFLQLNFKNSNKVLITETLVGFKPHQTFGLDMSKLPKVVTTPDLYSVFEAIEEALGSDQSDHEIEILKKVYQSILLGAERVGFELQEERSWMRRLLGSRLRASA